MECYRCRKDLTNQTEWLYEVVDNGRRYLCWNCVGESDEDWD